MSQDVKELSDLEDRLSNAVEQIEQLQQQLKDSQNFITKLEKESMYYLLWLIINKDIALFQYLGITKSLK